MSTPHSPVGARRRLGAELRRLRARAGMTLDEVAGLMTCSTSKISRLETGKGVPKVPDVSELMRIYGVASDAERDMLLRLVHDGRQHGWWERLTEGVQPERYVMDAPGRYSALENDALVVRSYSIGVVHGLLQTPDYAREVIRSWLRNHAEEQVEQLVELRVKRQEALFRSDPPPLEVDVVLDEAVLHRVVGGPGLMADQLRHVLRLAELPNVTIRVHPFDGGLLRAHAGTFVVLEIPAELGADVVYVEGHAGEFYLDAKADVALYKDVLRDVVRQALPVPDSLDVLTRRVHGYASSGRFDPHGRVQGEQLL